MNEAIGGFTAGIAGTVLGYPLDLVKTRMQTATVSSGRHCNVLAITLGIVHREGFSTLSKGMMLPVVSSCTRNAINFTTYSSLHNFYQIRSGWDLRNCLAGAAGAPIISTISTVENLIKTQMQLDNISRRQYHNSLHCLSTLLRDNGVKVLYTGFGINTFREIVYLGSYFFCYEGIRETLIQNSFSLQIAVPAAGGLAGSLGWLCSFPLDFVRARVHGQSFISGDRPYNRRKQTAIAIAESLFKERGIIGLYSGVTPSIIRAFLVSGVRFSAYEFTLHLLAGSQQPYNHHE